MVSKKTGFHLPLTRENILSLISWLGILFYLVFTGIAVALYPGGNKFNLKSVGYSFKNNFWCDLFSEVAYNGTTNPGRNYAISGNYIIIIALFLFWLSIPELFKKELKLAVWVKRLGPAAMVFSLLISTSLHDLGIHIAVPLGMLAFLLTLRGLSKSGEKFLAYLGAISAFIAFTNYLSLVFRTFPQYLALVQKFAILGFLIWVGACLMRLFNYHRGTQARSEQIMRDV